MPRQNYLPKVTRQIGCKVRARTLGSEVFGAASCPVEPQTHSAGLPTDAEEGAWQTENAPRRHMQVTAAPSRGRVPTSTLLRLPFTSHTQLPMTVLPGITSQESTEVALRFLGEQVEGEKLN